MRVIHCTALLQTRLALLHKLHLARYKGVLWCSKAPRKIYRYKFLTQIAGRDRSAAMALQYPLIGTWYRDQQEQQTFEVVAIDDEFGSDETQYVVRSSGAV